MGLNNKLKIEKLIKLISYLKFLSGKWLKLKNNSSN